MRQFMPIPDFTAYCQMRKFSWTDELMTIIRSIWVFKEFALQLINVSDSSQWLLTSLLSQIMLRTDEQKWTVDNEQKWKKFIFLPWRVRVVFTYQLGCDLSKELHIVLFRR